MYAYGCPLGNVTNFCLDGQRVVSESVLTQPLKPAVVPSLLQHALPLLFSDAVLLFSDAVLLSQTLFFYSQIEVVIGVPSGR